MEKLRYVDIVHWHSRAASGIRLRLAGSASPWTLFLGSLQFHAVPPAAATLRAVELLRSIYESGGRKWPSSLPTSFLRPVWREAVLGADGAERRIWAAATLLTLRDRLRAGDIWVEGRRLWRTVENQLISPALFAAMREAGPLRIAARQRLSRRSLQAIVRPEGGG